MRAALFAIALVVSAAAACGSKPEDNDKPATPPPPSTNPAEKPHHHEDRHDPQTGAPKLVLAITAGADKSTWNDAQFAAMPKIDGKASDGEARDTWDLRALTAQNAGATARVTAVIGESRYELSAADWADKTRVPILHTTRRGTLKFRWSDAAGKWGDTVVKEVSGLEIVK